MILLFLTPDLLRAFNGERTEDTLPDCHFSNYLVAPLGTSHTLFERPNVFNLASKLQTLMDADVKRFSLLFHKRFFLLY
jgi:hypothetical protein